MVIMDADGSGCPSCTSCGGGWPGKAVGVCLLVTDSPPGTTARERLDAVASTTDGFELARHDLELRREGDVLGASQSGRRSGLRLLSLLRDERTITEARDRAWALVAETRCWSGTPGWPAWSPRSSTRSARSTWRRPDRAGHRGQRRSVRLSALQVHHKPIASRT